jgi:hypothetical protein
VGPSGQVWNRKKKKVPVWFWAESGDGTARSAQQARLSSRIGLVCGSAGWLGQVGWLARLGLDAPWAAVGWRPSLPSSPLAGLPLRLLLLAAWRLLVFSFADRAVPCGGLGGIWCGEVRIRCGRRVRVCACGRRERVRG